MADHLDNDTDKKDSTGLFGVSYKFSSNSSSFLFFGDRKDKTKINIEEIRILVFVLLQELYLIILNI
ncbi:unnamed protein product [Ceratitis capitata]|uniref:(Mediterranean fruit fly) hypothetical protein n=1 Tax=Ceratitis capitata TaxID=7213 RepID=A0A811VFE4_CERCA|nr:unnamed protein product [Ceratitis capitata]